MTTTADSGGAPPPEPPAIPRVTEDKTCFLDLPAELRNEIYTLALVEDKHCHVISQTQPNIVEPAMLAVCKPVRNEALPIFYGANAFRCSSSYAIPTFLRRLEGYKRDLLRKVHCRVILTDTVLNDTMYAMRFNDIKTRLHNNIELLRGSGLRLDSLLMPLRVPGQSGWRWVSYDELDRYKVEKVNGKMLLVRN